jgi:hypothetical protein
MNYLTLAKCPQLISLRSRRLMDFKMFLKFCGNGLPEKTALRPTHCSEPDFGILAINKYVRTIISRCSK